MQLAAIARDDLAIRWLLRTVATEHDEPQALAIAQTFSNTLDPNARFWFRNVLGERPLPLRGNTEPEPAAA
jgi:hypothetical protein